MHIISGFPPQRMALAKLLSMSSLRYIDGVTGSVLQDFLRYFGVMAHRTNEAMMVILVVMTTVVLFSAGAFSV